MVSVVDIADGIGLQQRLGGSCLHRKGHGIGVFMTRPRVIDMELFKSELIKGHCYTPRLGLTLVASCYSLILSQFVARKI